MGNSNFFDKLMEETMGRESFEDKDPLARAIHYFKNNSLIFYELKYYSNLHAYRVLIRKSIIDFPANWNDFAKVKENFCARIIEDSELVKLLKDAFFKNNLLQGLILFKVSGHYYLIVSPEDPAKLCHELQLLNLKDVEEKIAA